MKRLSVKVMPLEPRGDAPGGTAESSSTLCVHNGLSWPSDAILLLPEDVPEAVQ